MTPRGGTHGNDDDLEVIELESTVTSERTKSRREGRPTTGTRRRRGPVLIAIVVVVALVVSALVNRSSSGRRRASTSTTQPGQAGVGLISVPIFPFRVGALALTGGSRGLQLIDTDTGKMTRPEIAGLPRGSVTIVAQSGGTAAVRVGKQLYWFTMGQRAAHAVGATTAFPSLHRGYLWIADSASATLVPGDTKPIALPGLAIGAARDGGLFVTTEDGVLLQSTTHPAQLRGILSAPATVIAVHADRLAWITNDCGVLRCPVHITEVETDATSTWLQLVGHPGPLVTAGTSGVFSPDGNYLVIIVPDSSATTAEGMVVADLRSRVTTTSYERGRIEEPARPGKVDATGVTIDWTLDSRFLLLAPPAGFGPIGAMDPATTKLVLSRAPIG
ncbi:MAG: hypothetical protein QOF28_3183, partial [Actinomycetota bacterium]|nr:hypothetical protein [Actinomycetota bacterium]